MTPCNARFEFNRHGVWAIYKFEIARALRTLVQTPGDAGNHHIALLRGVRRGHRIAHDAPWTA